MMCRHLIAGLMTGLSLTGTAVAQDAPETTAFDAGTVLATVNGVDITLGHAIVMRDRLPEQYQSLPDDVLMDGIIDQLVDQTLLSEQESEGPETDPLEVRLHLENERRGTLAARFVADRVGVAVDEAAIEEAYAERVEAFEPGKEFEAAHILVATEAEAADVIAQIEAGADFAELARTESTDPGSAPQGGALGWFGPGQMVPEFEAAVASMELGAISAPVQTQFGWHVVKLIETRETTPPSLAELRPELETALRQAKLQEEIDGLRAQATIERPDVSAPAESIRQSDLVKE